MENDKNRQKAPETAATLPDNALDKVTGGYKAIHEEAKDVLYNVSTVQSFDDGSLRAPQLKRAYQK